MESQKTVVVAHTGCARGWVNKNIWGLILKLLGSHFVRFAGKVSMGSLVPVCRDAEPIPGVCLSGEVSRLAVHVHVVYNFPYLFSSPLPRLLPDTCLQKTHQAHMFEHVALNHTHAAISGRRWSVVVYILSNCPNMSLCLVIDGLFTMAKCLSCLPMMFRCC